MKFYPYLGAPDPGLNQTANVCSDEDQLSDIVDWENLSSDNASDKEKESSRYTCPFIDYEAEVEHSSDDDFNNYSKKKVSRKNTFNLVNYSSSSTDNSTDDCT